MTFKIQQFHSIKYKAQNNKKRWIFSINNAPNDKLYFNIGCKYAKSVAYLCTLIFNTK